jgi:hypothetical protein
MAVEYLDPELAGEGIHAEQQWTSAVDEARIPDYKGIKSIAKYFPQFTGRPYQHQTFPCFLYHPTKDKVLVGDVKDGEGLVVAKAATIAKEKYGCEYRKSTYDEVAQGFPPYRWSYTGDWRAQPFEKDKKFNPAKPETGKHVVTGKEPAMAPADLVAATVAAVLAALNEQKVDPAISSGAIPVDEAELAAFKAWKNSMVPQAASDAPANALSMPAEDREEWDLWAEEAKAKGVKVDRRWSLDTLKAAVEKA